MAQSFGRVTVPVPGTKVQVSSKALRCHSILFQVLPTNIGKVYIGDSSLQKNVRGEYAILAPPTTNMIPTYSETLSYAAAALDLATYFLDVDNGGDGVLVSYLVG